MTTNPSNPWGHPSSEASRDWARQGHESSRLDRVFGARPATNQAPAGRMPRSRRAGRTVGAAAVLSVLAISGGSALAFRSALFPDVGDATTRSVWQNPGRVSDPDPRLALAASSTSTVGGVSTSTEGSTVSSTSTEPAPVTTGGPGSTSTPAAGTNSPSTTSASGAATTTADTTPQSTGTVPTSSSSPSSSSPSSSTPSSSSPSSSSPSSSSPSSSSPSSSVASSSSTPGTTAAPVQIAPFTKTYSSAGGSITVTWNGSRLSLDAVAPASGFSVEIEKNSASRIRVDFEGDDDDSRIEVRVEGGQVRVDID